MDLFLISREFLFRVCNHVKPCASLYQGREGESFYKEEKEDGWPVVKKESMTFRGLSPCQERRGVFLLPIVLCYHYRVGELTLLVSQLYLIEVSVY